MAQEISEQEIAEIRERLRARRAELVERVRRLDGNVGHRDEPLPADFEEQAIELENQDVLEALNDDARSELRQIQRALERMDAGDYGICDTCGDAIAPGRMKAIPSATRCIDCASQA